MQVNEPLVTVYTIGRAIFIGHVRLYLSRGCLRGLSTYFDNENREQVLLCFLVACSLPWFVCFLVFWKDRCGGGTKLYEESREGNAVNE